MEEERRRRRGVFMAFGTKGDVYPIAAIAAAYACDQTQYHVFLITHSAHQNLTPHLAANNVSFIPISTPPVVSSSSSSSGISFSAQKKMITKQHRQQCLSAVGTIFGDAPPSLHDFLLINFFALEGWSLAELFHVRCVVASPYVIPHSVPSSFERRFSNDLPHLYNVLQLAPSNSWLNRVLFTKPKSNGEKLLVNTKREQKKKEKARTGRRRKEADNLALLQLPLLLLWSSLLQLLLRHLLMLSCCFSNIGHFFSNSASIDTCFLSSLVIDDVCWKDVTHWMWPLFTEDWGSWRSELNLSPCPFTDPITGLPALHDWARSPLLSYGFSKEVVECPGYWPSNVRVCGFWFVPLEWQFTCNKCSELSVLLSGRQLDLKDELCSAHYGLQQFLTSSTSSAPIFIGFSSVGSMGFLKNSRAFLRVLEAVIEITSYRLILLTAGYEPLDSAIRALACALSCSEQKAYFGDGVLLRDRLFCFSSDIPYNWLFRRCAVAVHHGGSGSTAAALHTGLPQVICPFLLDQFYWAERMFWLGVAPEPLEKKLVFPDECDESDIWRGASVLSNAISSALSPEMKARASEIEKRVSSEDGVGEAVRALKEEMNAGCGR